MASLLVLEGPNRGAAYPLPLGEVDLGRGASCALVVPDESVSRRHALLLPDGEGGWRVRDLQSKNRTFVNGVQVAGEAALSPGAELRLGEVLFLMVKDACEVEEGVGVGSGSTVSLALETRGATAEAEAAGTAAGSRDTRRATSYAEPRARYLLGASEAMARLSRQVVRCAPLETTVLIRGETGTGKELVARALHELSPRARRPFVAVNCATLAPELVASELFGHERGAFTGAVARRLGKLELARRSTLFLDEVGELPPDAQAKLLRAIEERRFQRLGGVDDLQTDARIVAATHRPLEAMVKKGRFREDLYYRLRVVELPIPPLRERPDDIPPLVSHFLVVLARKIASPVRRLHPDALRLLQAYRFPGNVRELRNLLERLLIFGEAEEVRVADLPPEVRGTLPPSPPPVGGPLTLAELERQHVARVLQQAGGNKTLAAKLLGIDRKTLYAKLQRYGLS